MNYQSFSPIELRILSRREGFAALAELLGERENVLVLADGPLLDALNCRAFFEGLASARGGVWIGSIPANPGVDTVAAALNSLNTAPVEAIVALGGGSCIDLAKAISALKALTDGITNEDGVRALICEKSYLKNQCFIDIIALPTTAGTSSEVTRWATIWDHARGQKLSIDCPELYPKASLIIPELTLAMPSKLTLSTGLDALSHAMEAYWAMTRTPLSQALALDAIGRIRRDLPRAVQDGKSLDARNAMSLNALLAGLSFSLTRTTACHSISYPLTMRFSVPHGFAAALTLSPVMEANEDAVPEIAEIKRLFEEDGGFGAWLKEVSDPIQPLSLTAFGIDEDAIDAIAQGAFTAGRMDNNPVPLTEGDVRAILRGCL